MALPRVVITKTIGWHGAAEEFSNGYTLTGDHAEYDDTEWIALIDALVAIEKSFHGNNINYLEARASGLGEDVAHVRSLSGAGSRGATGATEIWPGELCQMAEARISSGRVLRKYYHCGRYTVPSGAPDLLQATDKPTTELVKLSNGTLPAGAKVCAPNGDIPAVAWSWDPYLRIHQFPARPPRPPAG